MAKLLRFGVMILGVALAYTMVVWAQDAPPALGDVARQARQQKQQKDAQSKDTQSKDVQPQTNNASQAKTPANADTQAKDTATPQTAKAEKHVFTNDEIPEHIGPTSTRPPGDNSYPNPVGYYPQQQTPAQGQAEQWKQQIQAMKGYIANMQAQITQTEQSIHYAGGNCISTCVQWNERQKQKQDQVEIMKQQVAEQQKRLEDMQEMARRQGFGSSVYDP